MSGLATSRAGAKSGVIFHHIAAIDLPAFFC
jgi:hypothetical protein